MTSRRRPGRETSETTKRYSTTHRAPNYGGDEAETLIRVMPLPVREEDDDGYDEMTMRHSSVD